MQISFDTENFVRNEKSLTNVLHYLNRHGCFAVGHYPEIEKITCRTPSSALRYTKFFSGKLGISPSSEAVFLKNPNLAVRYLRITNKKEFSDPSVQRRFRKKFSRNPRLAYDWARAFDERLSEEEEQIFRKDISAARDYAMYVIRGPFPEKVHSMILLASFENLSSLQKRHLSDYIKFAEKFSETSQG